MIIHHVIYLFSSVERAILSLQTSTTKRLVFLPCGPRQLQYKSISVLKRHSTTATSYTLPLGKRTAIGAVFTGKGGVHRRRSGSVVVVTLWSGTNKNRSFYRRSSVTVDHHHHLSGQVYWRKSKVKVKCTYWPLREP